VQAKIIVLVELRCLLCARVVGTLQAERWPPAGPVLYLPAEAERSIPVTDWRRIRCATCGRNTYSDEIRTVKLYPPVSWDELDPPRRGRPPKWLIAQRNAATQP
jgi:hypothetical protein